MKLVALARKELNYSSKHNTADIWWTLAHDKNHYLNRYESIWKQ
jgi:hypothetical protein